MKKLDFGRSLIIRINLEKILLNQEYVWYDLIKRFGFDSVKEDLIGFILKEDWVQDLFEKSYFGCSGETFGTRCFGTCCNVLQFLWIRGTCGTRCSSMCSTSGPGSPCQCCCIFGAKLWLRFSHICCYILKMRLCDLFDNYWWSNQFKWGFKFKFEFE